MRRCLEEVYESSDHVCLVLRWGTHELDGRNLLCAPLVEALRLLHELQPDASQHVMLRADDVQLLVQRVALLDCELQSCMWPE